MKAFLLLILLVPSALMFTSESQAQVGYVKITVLDYQPHDYPMDVSANGVHIATVRHSDASKPPAWIPLTSAHLSLNSNQTPLTTTASWNPNDCKFKFRIEFSSDGKSVTASLGTFDAPASTLAGYIPLGRKCEANAPICSSDINLQRAIAWDHFKALAKALLGFNQNVENGLSTRIASAEGKLSQTALNLKESSPPNVDKNSEILEEQIQKWQAEFESDQSHAAGRFDLEGDRSSTAPINFEDIVDKAIDATNSRSLQNIDLASLDPATGGPLSAFDEGIPTLIKDRRDLLELEIEAGIATQAQIRAQEQLEKAGPWFRIYILRGQAFCHATEVVLKKGSSLVAPEISAFMTAAELIRGKEVCPYGKTFTTEERATKLCELGMKFGFKGLGLDLTSDDPSQKIIVGMVKKKIQKGLCSAIVDASAPNE
jgi:hypothetical protein